MALTLIIGPANSGKTGALYDAVRNAPAGTVPTVLLPSAPDVFGARDELAGTDGLVAIRIEQIDRYLSGLWATHGDGRGLVTPVQRSALIGAAIRSARVDQVTGSAGTPGFARALEHLARVLDGRPSVDSQGQAGAIAAALSAYRDELDSRGLIEASEAMRVLLGRIQGAWFDGPLAANRFDDLTEAQESFLVAAAAAGADVYLALTGGEGIPGSAATEPVISRLRERAETVVECGETAYAPDELLELGRSLFVPGVKIASRGRVRLSLAYGEDAEAERIAAEAQQALDDGFDAEDIAVIFRDVRPYARPLQRAFQDAGLDAHIDMRASFSEAGLGRALLLLLRFASSGSRVSLSAFLGSGYAPIALDDVDGLDAWWRRAGLAEGEHKLLASLDRVGGPIRSFVERAVRLAHEGVSTETAPAWFDLVSSMLAVRNGHVAPLLFDRELGDAAAHRRVCDAIADLLALGEETVPAAALERALADAQIATAPAAEAGHIQVMDAERARGRRFGCVILGGLNAGGFPRTVGESLLSPGPLVAELERSGVRVPPDGGIERERLLFYLAVSRARRRLVLSRQAADSEGRPLRASVFLDELIDMYRDDEGDDARLPTKVLAFADLGLHETGPKHRRRALRSAAASRDDFGVPELVRSRRRAQRAPEAITDERVLARLSERHTFSVTELEAYLRCPHYWFYERLIAPEPIEERAHVLRKGTLAHDVLQVFYETLEQATGEERVTPPSLPRALAHLRGVLETVIAAGTDQRRLADRLLGEEVRRAVEGLIARDAHYLPGYRPVHLEWTFGASEQDVEDFGEFALKGRVDRIDVSGDAFVVIDYKTSGGSPAARFERDGVLQAPLYAEVVRRRLGGRLGGSFYRSIAKCERTVSNRGMYDPSILEGPELIANDGSVEQAVLIRDAVARAASAAAGIRSGSIPARPLSPDTCKYCRAHTWCAGRGAR